MANALYIINPAGRGGAGMQTWRDFKERRGKPVRQDDVRVTERPGHAREIAAKTSGYDVFVAVGDDGTVGEVISGVMDRIDGRPRIAIVPGGTGNDIARNLGMGKVEDAIMSLREGEPRAVDIVQVECDVNGVRRKKFAFLYGSAGFCSLPLVKPWMKRWLGAGLAYNLATLVNIMIFRAPHVTLNSKEKSFNGLSWW